MTAVDAAPEMLAIARQRVGNLPVELIEADVFGWAPPRRYDTVFFAFWLTHVPRPASRPSVHGWDGLGIWRAGLLPGRQQAGTYGRTFRP